MIPSTSTLAAEPQAIRASGTSAIGHKEFGGMAATSQSNVVMFSPRVRLVPLAIARWLLGLDAESVLARVDNELHAKHLVFAFDISAAKSQASARELRFWVNELAVPEKTKGISIEQAIAEILGARQTFSRGDIEIQWIVSASMVGNLIQRGYFVEQGNRILRASVGKFLLSRWAEANPI